MARDLVIGERVAWQWDDTYEKGPFHTGVYLGLDNNCRVVLEDDGTQCRFAHVKVYPFAEAALLEVQRCATS